MDCCKEKHEQSSQDIPFPITSESKQWLIMMKYMLECAEKSLEVMDKIKDDLDFNDEDLERFSVLCLALEQARYQMVLLGKKFFEDYPTMNFLDDLSIIIDPQDKKITKNTGYTQTGYDGQIPLSEKNTSKSIVTKRETTRKDACLCKALKDKVVRKSQKRKIRVCSPIERSSILNEKCLKDGTPKSSGSPEGKSMYVYGIINIFQSITDLANDDDHPYIIKNQGGKDVPETGFGYELFYAMHRHRNKIAQVGRILPYKFLIYDSEMISYINPLK